MPLKEWIADGGAHDVVFYKKRSSDHHEQDQIERSLCTEEVSSIGEREALDALWLLGMADRSGRQGLNLHRCVMERCLIW